jgi:hypothetical protein
MNVIWTPLTAEELAALKEGDSIVTHTGSKGAFQFHPAQRLHPEFFYIRDVKYVGKSPHGSSIMVLREGDDTPISEAVGNVGRFIQI